MGSAQDYGHDRLRGDGGLGVGTVGTLEADRAGAANYETVADVTTSPPRAASDEIRRDIDRTRHDMDQTLNALGQRLDPRSLLDEAWDMGRSLLGGTSAGEIDYAGTAKRVGASTLDALRENPIPAVLGGAAIAWMLFEDPVRREYRRRKYDAIANLPEYSGSVVDARTGKPYDVKTYGSEYRSTGSGPGVAERARGAVAGTVSGLGGGLSSVGSSVGHGVTGAASTAGRGVSSAGRSVTGAAASAGHGIADAASRAGGAVGETVRSAAEWIGDATHALGDQLTGATHRTTDALAGATHRTADASRRAGVAVGRSTRSGYAFSRERCERALDEAPLLVGLGCLAAGLVAGFVVPRTRVEDELLGEQSDHLKEEARHRAEEVYETAKHRAEEVYETTRHKAEDLFEQGKEKAAELAVHALDRAEASGVTPANLVDKAAQAVHKAAVSVTETVKDKAAVAEDKAREKADSLSASTGDSGSSSATAAVADFGTTSGLGPSCGVGSSAGFGSSASLGTSDDFGTEMAGEGKFSAGGTSSGIVPTAGSSFGTTLPATELDIPLTGGIDMPVTDSLVSDDLKKKDGGSCGC